MDKRYLVSIIKTVDTDECSNERYTASRIVSKKMIVDGPSPKKSIFNILLEELEQLKRTKKVVMLNRETFRHREFSDMHTFISWFKRLAIEKLSEMNFRFAVDGVNETDNSIDVIFSIAEYNENASKLLKLEIKDFITDKPILQKDYSDFKELDDFVQSLIDPSHKKFLPSNPCINVDCRFVVNGCDITDHFLKTNDLDIKCYELDGTQVIEHTKYRYNGRTAIHHVLAIEKHEVGYEETYTPRLVYSSVIEELGGRKRYRGISEGKSWEKEIKTPIPADNLYYKITGWGRGFDKVPDFKKLLDKYSYEYPVTSFVCIQSVNHYGNYVVTVREYCVNSVISSKEFIANYIPKEDYSHLITPHEQWTYEDFDVIS